MGRNMQRALVAAGIAVAGAAVGAAALGIRSLHCLQVLRTKNGMGWVREVAAPDGVPVRVLQQGGVYQSASYTGERWAEPVFTYYRGFDALLAAAPALGHPVRRVLMLGGGGFAYPRHLLTTQRDVHMDVVELDPAVVRAARRWFYLDELERLLADPATAQGNSLSVVEGDGRAFLEARAVAVSSGAAARSVARDAACADLRYDAIINDAFTGAKPVRALATLEAARAVRACLAPGGVYLTNVVSCGDGADLSFLRDEVATLARVFAHVHVLQETDSTFGGEDNYLVIATDGDAAYPDAIPYDAAFLGAALHDDPMAPSRAGDR